MYTDIYIKTKINNLIADINLSDYYNKTEIYDTDNELPTLILNTYSKHEIDTFFTDYYNTEYLNTQLGLKANGLNTYTKSE